MWLTTMLQGTIWTMVARVAAPAHQLDYMGVARVAAPAHKFVFLLGILNNQTKWAATNIHQLLIHNLKNMHTNQKYVITFTTNF